MSDLKTVLVKETSRVGQGGNYEEVVYVERLWPVPSRDQERAAAGEEACSRYYTEYYDSADISKLNRRSKPKNLTEMQKAKLYKENNPLYMYYKSRGWL